MTDFKIKIDLENQSVVQETPKKESRKRRKDPNRTAGDKSRRRKYIDHTTEPKSEIPNKKKKKKKKEQPHQVETEKRKINSNSIISLTLLPNNESANKLDQVQKLSLITKKKPRHWEKRWVLVPNVFEFTKEIWIKKWVLVDGGDDIVDNNVIFSFIYRIICRHIIQALLNLIRRAFQRNTNVHLMNVERYSLIQVHFANTY